MAHSEANIVHEGQVCTCVPVVHATRLFVELGGARDVLRRALSAFEHACQVRATAATAFAACELARGVVATANRDGNPCRSRVTRARL